MATNAAQRIELRFGGQQLTFDGTRPVLVGRGLDCGLRLDDPMISARHVVVWFDGMWRVRNEGRNGTFLRGRPVEEVAVDGPILLNLAGPSGPELVLVPVTAPAPGPTSDGWSPSRFTGQTPTVVPSAAPAGAVPFVPTATYGVPLEPPSAPGAPPAPGPPPLFQSVPGLPPVAGPEATSFYPILKDIGVSVGRDPNNTIVVDDLLVSRHHAKLHFDGHAWWLTDLNSANGTYVDGRRISVEQISSASLIGIGHRTFRLVDGKLAEYQDTGAVTFEARDLTVFADGRRILDNVSFVLEPSSMLVIVGPSGSGKSTLLRALTGTRPADQGQVGYGGRDLYSNYEEIRHRIGFVPQDDILHPQLRVDQALDYAGRLRFPADVDAQQRAARVSEVIHELGLVPQARQRVSTLSGGQRKRTSTAMELLTRPSLLFLDEPTSGLDINRDREVMNVLRTLADGGRTVVVVSHNVTYLNLASRILVLATGGQLAYYGPPKEALSYFGFADYADMYAALEQPNDQWRARFEQSPTAQQAASSRRQPITGNSADPSKLVAPRNQRRGAQFATLCSRYISVIAADRAFVGLTVLMPLILALFAHAVPGSQGLSVAHASAENVQHKGTHSPGQLLLVLIVGGCLTGGAASVREIVKERAIYARERAIGLSWGAYLASKVLVLSLITGVQAVVLTTLGIAGNPGPDDSALTSSGTFDIVLAMIGVTIASMCLSLILSVAVSNADRVMPLLVLVIMAQLLMSSGLFPVNGRPILEQLSWLSPARWGFAAGSATVNLNAVPSSNPPDPLWKHTGGVMFTDLLMMALLAVVYIGVTAALLRRIGRLRTAPYRRARP
jgi:ABC-type multidrug transport system ATPase subunit/pSer/pThr/pTyr-binding forkhead associated (FHA) protein